MGKTAGATANTIRDSAINEVRQFDIANAYPFSWLERIDTPTTSATGSVDLNDDFNVTHKLKDVRDANNNVFSPVNKEIFSRYSAGSFVYYIDYNTSTDKWQINTTEPSTVLTIIYYSIPATLTTDAQVDAIPDLIVIKYLSAARYWLTERNYGNYDRFNDMGMQRLKLLVDKDKKSIPQRLRMVSSADQGWNRLD